MSDDIVSSAICDSWHLASDCPGPRDCIFYGTNQTELLRLTPDGFIYQGKTIADAGEAHRAFMSVMGVMSGRDTRKSALHADCHLTDEECLILDAKIEIKAALFAASDYCRAMTLEAPRPFNRTPLGAICNAIEKAWPSVAKEPGSEHEPSESSENTN